MMARMMDQMNNMKKEFDAQLKAAKAQLGF